MPPPMMTKMTCQWPVLNVISKHTKTAPCTLHNRKGVQQTQNLLKANFTLRAVEESVVSPNDVKRYIRTNVNGVAKQIRKYPK